MKRRVLLSISAKLELAKCCYFLGAIVDRPYGEILASVWQQEGNFGIVKRC